MTASVVHNLFAEAAFAALPWVVSIFAAFAAWFLKRELGRMDDMLKYLSAKVTDIEIKLQQVNQLQEFRTEILDQMRRIEDKLDRKVDR